MRLEFVPVSSVVHISARVKFCGNIFTPAELHEASQVKHCNLANWVAKGQDILQM